MFADHNASEILSNFEFQRILAALFQIASCFVALVILFGGKLVRHGGHSYSVRPGCSIDRGTRLALALCRSHVSEE